MNRPKWILGAAFAALPYQAGSGWPIGYRGQIPWYCPKERIFLRQLLSHFPTIVGPRSLDKFSWLDKPPVVVSRRTEISTLDKAMRRGNFHPQFVLGGRRILEAAMPHLDFLIVNEVHQQRTCSDFVAMPQPSEFLEVKIDWHDGWTTRRYIRQDFPNGHYRAGVGSSLTYHELIRLVEEI